MKISYVDLKAQWQKEKKILLPLINLGSRINLDLVNGIYLVELISNGSSTMRKLVVNR